MASMVPCILDSSVDYNAILQEPKSRGREGGRERGEGRGSHSRQHPGKAWGAGLQAICIKHP